MAAEPPVRPEPVPETAPTPSCAVRAVGWAPAAQAARGKPPSKVELTQAERHLEKALTSAGIKQGGGKTAPLLVTEGLKIADPTARHWAVLEAVRSLRSSGRPVRILERAYGALTRQSGLMGLARTLRQEWPEMDLACWSLAAPASKLDLAGALVSGLSDAVLTPEGVLEQVIETERPALSGAEPYSPGIWLVSGGARGVTSDCVLALAERLGGGTFLLAGRSMISPWPEGIAETDDLKALRLSLINTAKTRGEKPKPKDVDALARTALAGREIRTTLAGLEALGARAEYLQLDLGDGDAVAATLAEAQARHGAITGCFLNCRKKVSHAFG